MSSLQVMVKKSRGKKQQEETEKPQHVIATENKFFKEFTTKGIRDISNITFLCDFKSSLHP